ncbi:MAG: fibronectin type III domain-containing protein [Prevotellaceae bacterium]|jgi:hypothetical protein|nr:fibronectin type III domain-containing protein [Prevotellaceae bacterium]
MKKITLLFLTTLFALCTQAQTTNYTVSSIPYSPFPFTNIGTNIVFPADDQYGFLYNLPFDFEFYGNSYNQIAVASNGYITFDVGKANQFCPWDLQDSPDIPSANFQPQGMNVFNSIFGVFEDTYATPNNLNAGDGVFFVIYGESPNRSAVVTFKNVPLYPVGNNQRNSYQIVLHENGDIDVCVAQRAFSSSNWNQGIGVIGIINSDGTQGIAAPGRNITNYHWSVSNSSPEAWRFSPPANAACPKPTNIQTSNISAVSADILWTAGSTETQWALAYRKQSESNYQENLVQNTTTYQLTGLEQGTTYYVQMKSLCANNEESYWTSEYMFTTLVSCPAPTNLIVSNIADASAILSWATGGSETQWLISYKKVAETNWSNEILVSTNPTYTLTGLDALTNYDVRIRSFCAANDYSAYLQNAFVTELCATEDKCTYTLTLNDSFGDGWEGSTLTFKQNGIAVGSRTLNTGHSGTQSIQLCSGIGTEIFFTRGSSINEIAFILKDMNDVEVFSVIQGQASTLSTSSSIYSFISCEPVCYKPDNVQISNITETTAEISWVPQGNTNQWLVSYKKVSEISWSNEVLVSNVTNHQITGLDAGAYYQARIRATCNGYEFSNYAQLNFTTECSEITELPWTEDFERYSTDFYVGTLPPCMVRSAIYSFGTYTYPAVYKYANTNTLDFYGVGANHEQLIALPRFQDEINNLKISFDAYQQAGSINFVIGVMSDPYDKTTFVPVQTVTGTQNTVVFPPSTAGYHYIGIDYNHSVYSDLHIDNIVVEYQTTCQPVTNISISNITENAANVSWSGGTATQWNVSYKKTSETAWSSNVLITGTPTCALTGLDSLTLYDVRVRAICGTNDLANYRIKSFATVMPSGAKQCNFVLSLNEITSGGNLHDTIAFKQNGIEIVKYPINSGQNITHNVSLFSGIDCELDYISLASHVNSALTLSITDEDGAILFNIAQGQGISLNINTPIFTFTPLCDLTCRPINNLNISNISDTSAVIAWTPIGTETQWLLSYKKQADSNWSSEILVANLPHYTLQWLDVATQYDVRVRAFCAVNDTSAYRQSDFTTLLCLPENRCVYTLQLISNHFVYSWSYKDYIKISQNGTEIGTYFLDENSPNQNIGSWITIQNFEVSLCAGMPVNIDFFTVNSTIDLSLQLFDSNGIEIYNISAAQFPNAGTSSNPALLHSFIACEQISGCSRPANIRVTDITPTYHAFSWNSNGATQWLVSYKKILDVNWSSEILVNDTMCQINNIEYGSDYNIRVRALCVNNDYSQYAYLFFVSGKEMQHLPINYDFENNTDFSHFMTLYNHSASVPSDTWMSGNATGNTGNSMYVTSDSITNSYSTDNNAANAVLDVSFGDAEYFTISFDWKGQGELNADYCKLYIQNINDTIPRGEDYAYLEMFHQNNTWQHYQQVLPGDLYRNTTKRIVFLWKTDWSNNGDDHPTQNPPIAIDNFSLTAHIACPPQPEIVELYDTIYSGDQYYYLDDTLTVSGTYTYNLTNAFGCDSVVLLALTCLPLPVPSNLVITETENSVVIGWDNVVRQVQQARVRHASVQTANVMYAIYKNNQILAEIDDLYYDDFQVSVGESYCYKVRTILTENRNMESDFCDAVCITKTTTPVENLNLDNFVIYPNPVFNGYLTISNVQLLNETIQIIDIAGKIVMNNIQYSINNSVDVSSLANGMYFVKIGNKTAKFVKK